MKFVLVHGFNVKDGGKNTVDQLAPFILNASHTVDLDEGTIKMAGAAIPTAAPVAEKKKAPMGIIIAVVAVLAIVGGIVGYKYLGGGGNGPLERYE